MCSPVWCIAIRARGIQCSQQIRPPTRVSPISTDARPLPSPRPQTNLNYSYADYDVRHSLSADYIWDLSFPLHKFAINEALGGWSIAGKTFWRSGQPFTVYNSSIPNSINGTFASGATGGNEVIADVAGTGVVGRHCNSSTANPATPCFSSTDFLTSAQADFLKNRRNSFFGPHYADTDLSLYKSFTTKERGANAYNVFNNPNLSEPRGERSVERLRHHLNCRSPHQPVWVVPECRCRRSCDAGFRQDHFLAGPWAASRQPRRLE